MRCHTTAAVAFVMMSLGAASITRAQGNAQLAAPRPIDAVDSLWTEELTWMEVRDAVKAGKTTILIGTGGVEQNGPYEDQWSWDFLKAQGIVQIDNTPPAGQEKDRRTDTRNGMHDDIYYEAQIAVQDPTLIRADQRLKAGLFTLHGVDQAPVSKTIEIGKKLAEYRAGITARAFKASLQKLRPAP